MNNSGKPVCKEVRSRCKCIVKERPLRSGTKSGKGLPGCESKDKEVTAPPVEPGRIMDNTCKATITGEIKLPANCCLCCKGGNTNNTGVQPDHVPDESGTSSCMEAYRNLGECLHNCILQQCKKNTNQGYPDYGRPNPIPNYED